MQFLCACVLLTELLSTDSVRLTGAGWHATGPQSVALTRPVHAAHQVEAPVARVLDNGVDNRRANPLGSIFGGSRVTTVHI